YTIEEQQDSQLTCVDERGIHYHIYFTLPELFARSLLLTTGSAEHIQEHQAVQADLPILPSEEEIYEALGLSYIEPDLLEGADEIDRAKQRTLPQLITFADLKGTLHNHSTYSDGVHSLQQMALYCKDELGLSYFGICDHSKTAVYASGLTIERVQEQWAEID